MTEVESCSYTYDPQESDRLNTLDESKLAEDGKWHCPHPKSKDHKYCVFHKEPVADDSESVAKEFVRIVRGESVNPDYYNSTERRLEFIDVSFNSLKIRHTTLEADSNYPIDLRYSDFENRLDVSYSNIKQPLYLDGCNLSGGILGLKANFQAQFDCRGATIGEFSTTVEYEVTSNRARRVVGGLGFPEATFRSGTRFSYSQLKAGTFYNTKFESGVEMTNINVSTVLDMEMSTIGGICKIDGPKVNNLVLNSSTCNREVFIGCDKVRKIECAEADFKRSVRFVSAGLSEFESEGATFEDDLIFDHCTFNTDFTLENAKLRSTIQIKSPSTDQSRIVLSLSESDIREGEIELYTTASSKIDQLSASFDSDSDSDTDSVDCLTVDISDATIGDVQFRTAEDSIWKSLIVRNTEFNNFEFESYIGDLESINYNLHISSTFARERAENSSTSYEQIKKNRHPAQWQAKRVINGVRIPEDTEHETDTLISTFLQLKNGASKSGDLHSASEFFIREYYFRQQQARKTFLMNEKNLSGRTTSFLRWGSYAFLASTSAYGERTRRVIGFSAVIILLFGGIFYSFWGFTSGTPNPPYDGGTGALLLSIESFTTLVLGGAVVENRLVRLIADIEGFLGAFFIALFVFSLTRSIHR